MAYEYERINSIGCMTSAISTDQAVEELQEVYRKAKAWDNYEDSVRSLISKHADEDTDIEKEVRDILCVYLEDE